MRTATCFASIDDYTKGSVMKAGDIAAMPADISHRGYAPKRSMLLVWENMTPGLEQRYSSGELAPTAAEF